MPMEYIIPNLHIAAVTGMDDVVALEEHAAHLVQLEEDRFISGFHECIKNDRDKAWHDCNIKKKKFQQ